MTTTRFPWTDQASHNPPFHPSDNQGYCRVRLQSTKLNQCCKTRMIDRRPCQRLMMLSSEATPHEQFSSLHPCRSAAVSSRSYHSMLWQTSNDCCTSMHCFDVTEDSSIFSVWSVFNQINGSNVCEFNERSLQHSFSCSTRAPRIDTRMTAVPAELCFVSGININIITTTILMTPNPISNNINDPKYNQQY